MAGDIFFCPSPAPPVDPSIDAHPLDNLSTSPAGKGKTSSGCTDSFFDDYDFSDLFSPAEIGLAFHPSPCEATSRGTDPQPDLVPGSTPSPAAPTSLMAVPTVDGCAAAASQPPLLLQPQQLTPIDWLAPCAALPHSASAAAGAAAAVAAAFGSAQPAWAPQQAMHMQMQAGGYGCWFPDPAHPAGLPFSMPFGFFDSGAYSAAAAAGYGAPYGVAASPAAPPAAPRSGMVPAARVLPRPAPAPQHHPAGVAAVPVGASAGAFVHSRGVPLDGGAGGEPEVRTRAYCLERYRAKRARRLFTKTVRYHLRKLNADNRPRVKGRFVKKDEGAEDVRPATHL